MSLVSLSGYKSHKNYFFFLQPNFWFLVIKVGSSVSLIISGIHCSFGFIIFLKDVTVNVFVKL